MRREIWSFLVAVAIPFSPSAGIAQEGGVGDSLQSNDDRTYFDLRRSSNRATQLTAERYFNLVKLQEWSDAAGKSKVTAKYIAHDPDLGWVKLQAVRGSGADRVIKEITVPVEKLSKLCQSRVRQIDMLQKKLNELLASEDEADSSGPADLGAPMTDERGEEPRSRTRRRQPGLEQPIPGGEYTESQSANTETEEVPSIAFDPDPLGFAEIAHELTGDVPPSHSGPGGPGAVFPPGFPSGERGDTSQWASSYAAFVANFSVRQEPGLMEIDWGQFDALRGAGELAASDPESLSRNGSVPAEGLAPVQWEAEYRGIEPGGDGRFAFDLPPLPSPLTIEFRIDPQSGTALEDWDQVVGGAGNRVRFQGRLAMSGPYSIVVLVSDPQPASSTLER